MNILTSLYGLLTSFLITILVTPAVILIAKKFNLTDDVRKRSHPAHTHTGVIPRAGGLAIYIGLLCTALIFISFNKIIIM